jgi:hypothetical protein
MSSRLKAVRISLNVSCPLVVRGKQSRNIFTALMHHGLCLNVNFIDHDALNITCISHIPTRHVSVWVVMSCDFVTSVGARYSVVVPPLPSIRVLMLLERGSELLRYLLVSRVYVVIVVLVLVLVLPKPIVEWHSDSCCFSYASGSHSRIFASLL